MLPHAAGDLYKPDKVDTGDGGMKQTSCGVHALVFLKPKVSIQVIYYYYYYHYHYYLFLVSQFLLPEVRQATSFLGSGLGGVVI